MKKSLKKALYVLFPLAVYYVVHNVSKIILVALLNIVAGHINGGYEFVINHNGFFTGIISAIDMIIGAISVLMIMKYDYDELSIWDYLNLNTISFYRKDRLHPAWFSWALIVVQAISAAIGLNILLYLIDFFKLSQSYNEASDSLYSFPVWLGVILFGFISPAVEELLFRTVIFSRMKRNFPYVISVIATSIFFGMYHGNLVQAVYGGLMGMLMCIACEYVHTVVGAFVLHSVANLTVYLLSYKDWLVKIANLQVCVIMCVILVLTLVTQFAFSRESVKKLGPIEGVGPVGIFLYQEY